MLLAPLICLALCRLLELCSLRRRSPESKELEIGVLRVGCVNPIGWAVVRRRDLASVLRRELTGRPTNTDDYVYAPHRLLLPLLTRESRSAEPFSRNDCYSSWMSRKGCRPGSRSLP